MIQNLLKHRFRWWHGLAIFTLANAISALPAGYGGDKIFYNNFRQPSFAPPDWAFAPMWLFLNITSIVALARIWNGPAPAGSKAAFLRYELWGWFLFAIFTIFYFGLRSSTLGAIDTVAGLLVAIPSLAIAYRYDRWAASFILLRVLWLLLASAVSVWIALNNRDPLWANLWKS